MTLTAPRSYFEASHGVLFIFDAPTGGTTKGAKPENKFTRSFLADCFLRDEELIQDPAGTKRE